MIHRTLTWTARSLTCVRDYCYAYTHRGWAHRQRVSTALFTRKNSHKFFLCSWRRRGLNLLSLYLESDALPTELPRLPGLGLYNKSSTLFKSHEIFFSSHDFGLQQSKLPSRIPPPPPVSLPLCCSDVHWYVNLGMRKSVITDFKTGLH